MFSRERKAPTSALIIGILSAASLVPLACSKEESAPSNPPLTKSSGVPDPRDIGRYLSDPAAFAKLSGTKRLEFLKSFDPAALPSKERRQFTDLVDLSVFIENAEVIRQAFRDPRAPSSLSQQIQAVLDAQFRDTKLEEVAGSVHLSGRDIVFQIVKAQITEELHSLTKKFEAGEGADFGPLLRFVRERESQLTYMTESHGRCVLTQVVLTAIQSGRSEAVSAANRSEAISFLKDSLAHSAYLTGAELGITEDSFLAAFHVHFTGNPPSEYDLASSKELCIPHVVIAAPPDYKLTGVKIFLVTFGQSELIYDGALPLSSRK